MNVVAQKHAVSSWSEFTDTVSRIESDYTRADGRPVQILYRGHADAAWLLRSTLERRTERQFTVSSYYARLRRYVYQIEAFTGAQWGLAMSPQDFEKQRSEEGGDLPLPSYEFLVYLRHHGFPSPLLDWSESPYIAAFFALANPGGEKAAVYCFVERPDLTKERATGTPQIYLKGPYTRTHSRHFAQKAWYTIAARYDDKAGDFQFCPYKGILQRKGVSGADRRQDVLIRIDIPSQLRRSALMELDKFGLSHFTLFGSEESLIASMAAKEFDLSN